jgi:ankyrin repeat protein
VRRNLRRILEKLPKTLDETYERVLKNINENNRDDARRLLHCLAVAIRPLRVEELAEILAFDFDDVEGGIPKFCADWQLKDQEGAVLSTCSSLISVVDGHDSDVYPPRKCRVVQFAHFSVKEFLLSDRLASSVREVSRYHILPGPAHTTLAQACLGLFLHMEDPPYRKSVDRSALAKYAAEHWAAHTQFEDVSSRVRDGIWSLFNPNKQHFVRWRDLCDEWSDGDPPNPLYYASLYGFHDLVEHFVINHPQLVNTIYGEYNTPLLAALSGNHLQLAEFLLRHGGKVDRRGWNKRTALHTVIAELWKMDDAVLPDIILFLLKHGARVDPRDRDLRTPLHLAALRDSLADEAAQLLLDHGADVDACDGEGKTPLHLLFEEDFDDWDRLRDIGPKFVCLFLEHGANVNAQDQHGNTPLYLAMEEELWEAARILLENGAYPDMETKGGCTASLHQLFRCDLSSHERLNLARLLLERGAKVNARWQGSETPLHWAMRCEYEIAEVLLEHGAEPNMVDDNGRTPLHRLLIHPEDTARFLGLVLSLLERGADVNSQDGADTTLLHLAMEQKLYKVATILLEHGAEPNMKNDKGQTALHLLLEQKYHVHNDVKDLLVVGRLLLESGADVNAQDEDHTTPLYLVSNHRNPEVAQIILDHANAEKDRRRALLHLTLEGEYNF